MTVKERLHRAIEDLTEEQAEVALRRIDVLRDDPLVRYMDSAPIDDEAVTAEEQAAVAEADADRVNAAPRVPFDEIKRKYG